MHQHEREPVLLVQIMVIHYMVDEPKSDNIFWKKPCFFNL